MSTYDALRDSPKHGGVHYFNNGHGKAFIPPPRMSSKSSPLVQPALSTSQAHSQSAALPLASTIARLRASSSTAGDHDCGTSQSAIEGFRPQLDSKFDLQTIALTEKALGAM
jgi:hypothetical protein